MLPYHGLGGAGLERLCFELLLSMGYEPRDSKTDAQWVLAKRLAKLCPLGGKDLLLLDEVLTLIESAAEIETLSRAEMCNRVRHAYFGYKTADDLLATRASRPWPSSISSRGPTS